MKPTYRQSWAGNVFRFDLGPLLQGQTRIAKLDVVTFGLGPYFQIKRGQPNLKVLIIYLLLVLEVWDGKLTYRKSWAGNLLVRSEIDLGLLLEGQTRIAKPKSAYNSLIIGPRGLQCETDLWEIMGWESFDVFRFDLGPLLQGQMRIAKLKSAYNSLILGPRGLEYEANL